MSEKKDVILNAEPQSAEIENVNIDGVGEIKPQNDISKKAQYFEERPIPPADKVRARITYALLGMLGLVVVIVLFCPICCSPKTTDSNMATEDIKNMESIETENVLNQPGNGVGQRDRCEAVSEFGKWAIGILGSLFGSAMGFYFGGNARGN